MYLKFYNKKIIRGFGKVQTSSRENKEISQDMQPSTDMKIMTTMKDVYSIEDAQEL